MDFCDLTKFPRLSRTPKRGPGAGVGIGMLRGREMPLIESQRMSQLVGFLASLFESCLMFLLLGFKLSKFQNVKDKNIGILLGDINPI